MITIEEMRMTELEDKQLILDLLLPALQATRGLYDLEELQYDGISEKVIAVFKNGYRKLANVAMDSGTSMILDVIRQIR